MTKDSGGGGVNSKSTTYGSGSSGQANVLVNKNNAQATAAQQGQRLSGGGANRPQTGPFRQTLNNPSMNVDNIPQKARMFPQSFCPPPCPMPMCCPPPCCYPSFPCQPCMPRAMMCPFPCNPWCPPPACCPPCFPPPMPCCPPPMPCCPPSVCCPPPCCPTITRKCCCISGNKRIICIPRGKTVTCGNPCSSPCDPCEKPASYNNCNFYVSECPQAAQQDSCPCPDPCAGEFGNAAAGDDRIFPRPRRDMEEQFDDNENDLDTRPDNNYRRPTLTRQPPTLTRQPPTVTRQPPTATRQPPTATRQSEPKNKMAQEPEPPQEIDVKISSKVNIIVEEEGEPPRQHITKKTVTHKSPGSSIPRKSNTTKKQGQSGSTGHSRSDGHPHSDADGHSDADAFSDEHSTLHSNGLHPSSGREATTRGFTESSNEPDHFSITEGNSGTVIRISSDTTVRAVLNSGNSGTTIRETTPTTATGGHSDGTGGGGSSKGTGGRGGGNFGHSGNGSPDNGSGNDPGGSGSRKSGNKRGQGGDPDADGQRRGGDPNTDGQRRGSDPNEDGQRRGGDPNAYDQRRGGDPNAYDQRRGGDPNTDGQRRGSDPNDEEGQGHDGGPRTSVTFKGRNGGRDGKPSLDIEAEQNINVRARIPRSHSDPETTTRRKRRKKHKKKRKKKRSKSIPDVRKKRVDCYAPFRDCQFGPPAPVRTLYQNPCSNPCPWTDPCDYSYRPDPCGHRDTFTLNSPCGQCYRDYDVCTAILGGVRWPPATKTFRSPEDSRPNSPEVSFTYRRDKAPSRSRSSTRSYKERSRRGPRGLPMPSPSDTSIYENFDSDNRMARLISSRRSVDSVHQVKTPRPFRLYKFFDLNMNRSSTSRSKVEVSVTRSLVNISQRDFPKVRTTTAIHRERESRSQVKFRWKSQLAKAPSPLAAMANSFPRAQRACAHDTKIQETKLVESWQENGTQEVTLMPLEVKVEELNPKCWKPGALTQIERKLNLVNLELPKVYCSKENVDPKSFLPVSKYCKSKKAKKQQSNKLIESLGAAKVMETTCNTLKLDACLAPEKSNSKLNSNEPCVELKSTNSMHVQASPPCCDMCTGPSPASSAISAGVNQETECDFDFCPPVSTQGPTNNEPIVDADSEASGITDNTESQSQITESKESDAQIAAASQQFSQRNLATPGASPQSSQRNLPTPGASPQSSQRNLPTPGASPHSSQRNLPTPGASPQSNQRNLAVPGAVKSSHRNQPAAESSKKLKNTPIGSASNLKPSSERVVQESNGETVTEGGQLASPEPKRRTQVSKIPQLISRPMLHPPHSPTPASASSASSVSSSSRPYSPGEILGATTDDSTDPGSTITIFPPKAMTPPKPKPRKLPPPKHDCSDICPPEPTVCLPLLPPLRTGPALVGTNVYRPRQADCSAQAHEINECCGLNRGGTNINYSRMPLNRENPDSDGQFQPRRSFGFQPDLTQAGRTSYRSNPVSPDLNGQFVSPDCAPRLSCPLSVQGHRIPQLIPSNTNSVILPRLPSPRNKPRTIMPPSIRRSGQIDDTNCDDTGSSSRPGLPIYYIPRQLSSCPGGMAQKRK